MNYKCLFFPEKYWNVNDKRIPILKKYLNSLNIDRNKMLPTEEIISVCIDSLKTFKLDEQDRVDLKNLILDQNAKILVPCILEICNQFVGIRGRRVTLISLGCGDEGLFEKLLNDEILKKLPELDVDWVGVDIADFRGETSFFNNHTFVIVDNKSEILYKTLVSDEETDIILLGRYSYHHLGLSFEKFIERCEGVSNVILIEEPTTEELWDISDYRIMRIAYDVLANTVFSVDWTSEFMKDKTKFKINYIKTEKLNMNYNLIQFDNVLPETAMISINLK